MFLLQRFTEKIYICIYLWISEQNSPNPIGISQSQLKIWSQRKQCGSPHKWSMITVTRWIIITYLIHPVKSFVPFFFHGSSWLIKVNDLFTLSYPHLFQIWYSKIYIMFPLTLCTIHEYKTSNDVSEFMHSNCITLSYYSRPTHKNLISKCSTQSLSLLYKVI